MAAKQEGGKTMQDVLHVTGCRVFLNQSEDERLKGFASIILNDEFAVCDLKIINGNKGLFVAMPSRRRRDGSFHDVAHPIVSTLREQIESVVLGEYHQLISSAKAGAVDGFHRTMAISRQAAEELSHSNPFGMDDDYTDRRR